MDDKNVELLQADLLSLKDKVEKMEKEIKGIKQPIEKTLVDLRLLLSELENPFNYIQKFLPINELEKSKEEKSKEEKTEPEKKFDEEKTDSKTIPKIIDAKKSNVELILPTTVTNTIKKESSEDLSYSDWLSYTNTLSCAYILLNIFGRNTLQDVLIGYLRKNWITKEIVNVIEDAIDTIMKSVSAIDEINLEEPRYVTVEDHLIAIYLIDRLSKNRADLIFQIIPKLVSKYNGFKFGDLTSKWVWSKGMGK
ncbi:MAG: hypothetical protein QXX95_03660 [Nitrososphaerales archaeon]